MHLETNGSARCQSILQQRLWLRKHGQQQRAADAGHRSPGRATPRLRDSKGLRMQVIGPQGEQHHGCGTPRHPSTPARRLRGGQEERPTHPKERSRFSSGLRAAASASAHICSHLPSGRGRLRSRARGHAPGKGTHGEGVPLTYFSYSALSRSQRESLCFCQSLPCLQVVRRTTSSPLWT